jgi:hypothetical protein
LRPVRWASLERIPLHLALTALGPGARLAAIAGLTALGTWSANRLANELNEEDPQSIVIDEVVGTLIALNFARRRGPCRPRGRLRRLSALSTSSNRLHRRRSSGSSQKVWASWRTTCSLGLQRDCWRAGCGEVTAASHAR